MEMENSEHASIDINKLAATLRENLLTLHPLSAECCIYRVPQSKRCLDESAFTPQVISIGPFHYGRPELTVMEKYKRRYLKDFLQRNTVSIEEFLTFIKDNKAKLRNSYAEIIELQSEEFVTMILMDAIFLIEYFFKYSNSNFVTNDDRIFKKPKIDIDYDLWLVENQLPFFILNHLINLAKTTTNGEAYRGFSLIKSISKKFNVKLPIESLLIEENLLEVHSSKAEHLLDLIRLFFQPSQSLGQHKFKLQNIPTITELHQAGVQFNPKSSKILFDITFNKGVLEIPLLEINDATESFIRNLLVFEELHSETKYINDYFLIMTTLVKTSKDAELLVQHKVIRNYLGDSAVLSTFFHNLNKNTTLYEDDFHYACLVGRLKTYCSSPWHKWKATLKQDYFNTPWASISVLVAVILLLLTLTQTVCSIIAL